MSHPTLPASGSGSSKLPIPRLHKQRSEPPRKPPVIRQNRVSRACLSCRSRKIKCNGQQPRCLNCSENATSCVYASSRKDRLKTATTQNQDMITMLRDLRQHTSTERAARIDDLLASVIEDVADAAATVSDPTDKYRGPIFGRERGEADVSVEVGSSGEPDLLDEDAMQDEEIRATDFVGETSEVQRLRKLHRTSTSNSSERGPRGPPDDDDVAINDRLTAIRERRNSHPSPPLMPASKASFYLDDEVFETDIMVDPFEMPPFETAERLLQAYLDSAHNSFPILAKKTFLNRFYHYYAARQQGSPYNVPRKWQATLNLVFAIGAVYIHMNSADWQADDRDHLLYHSRAWALSLRDPWWFSHPDLAHMQITGLLSFYYLSIGHINRSWVLIGSAMRSGFTLGMHLRSEDSQTGAVRKEVNSRIWWAHYALERLVSSLTGRPSLGVGYLCSVPLPLPLSSDDIEEPTIQSRCGDKDNRPQRPQRPPGSPQAMDISAQHNFNYETTSSGPANSGSYLKSIVNLGEITQAALELYATDTAKKSWESVQRSIAHENDALDAWATDLPEGLNFFHKSHVVGHKYRREQNTLDILYHSTKILIMRPCLCRLDRRISHQTADSSTFNQRAALLCVESAKSIANLLPDAVASNLVLLYQAGPWWQMVHVIMQALVVLLLEVVLESRYSPHDCQDIIPSMQKLLCWLRVMRVNNGMAVRAYSLSLGLMKELASIIKFDIRDLVKEDDARTSPAKPSLAPSVPASTYTPYPDVLNPIEEPQTVIVPLAAPVTTQNLKQQEKQQHAHEALSHSQFRSAPSQGLSHQISQNTEPIRLPPRFAEHDLDSEFSAYDNLFKVSSGYEQVTFPGCVVTSFDEHDLFSGTGFRNVKSWAQENSLGQGDKKVC
ncbi:uncharacterized protein M421DRAFT_414993 [Didymella exigua CBS 183.55]|uniref:Zn(2)-C6 fungal-type domain-containing protein n=1 Tax=Didymella exigua CBS 183.55 TaxID=1150837 RepID=A0A6A5RZQ2_9PLEO|nr:uncharacterized protein M421DRAFT_414993 [Didymella exigua CBS 183.55]KAF1933945.1 hypothetical protein M421DRAFT_414993 [Didymella exigua CBS 183.55]